MIKVMVVFGTRPEAIKMAPLIKEIEKNENMECCICVTGQHRQMLDQVLQTFSIIPDYDLNIMHSGQTLSDIMTRSLIGMEKVIQQEQPDIVLVHGDTSTTFASSLAAFYNQIKIGHVEAGLRTFNIYSPYPEEANRQMVSVLSNLHFAPTQKSAENLFKEGKQKENIFITGNTAIDAMQHTITDTYYHEIFDWIKQDRMILLTAHRRENLGEPMYHIFSAIKRIVDEFSDVKVVYPIHLNPKIRKIANEVLGNCSQIRLIEPLEVVDFHNFMNHSYLILTDSGGVQEEAPSLGKPVLVLRDTTERPEGIEAGTLKLVGTNENNIYNCTKQLLEDASLYTSMSKAENPYGDGKASVRIVKYIEDFFRKCDI